MTARSHVITLANQYWISRCLHTAALFGFADRIDEDGKEINQLAQEAGLDFRILRSVIRVLSGHDIFSLQDERIFHTESSRLLRVDNAETIIDIVRWSASRESWRSLEQFPAALASGKSGFEEAFDVRFFDYLAKNAEAREAFDRSMDGYTRKQAAGILDATDLSDYETIVDVGGGSGLLARAIAERYPSKHVILFDLPGVVPQECEDIAIVRGNFFVDALPSADLVLLVNVLHDWNDHEILKLLKRVRESLRPGGAVYVAEGLISPGKPSMDLMDLGMALMTAGRQRSGDEYRRFLAACDLQVRREIECSEFMSILVAEPAQASALSQGSGVP